MIAFFAEAVAIHNLKHTFTMMYKYQLIFETYNQSLTSCFLLRSASAYFGFK
ncbi:hypothetical protein MtrunA17_Chr2g0321421 [Medicago truncatula]|uniref:Uncharacterized protein n=1 Tax=Medicago truncatula TaxID=3880 RepID=A0A396JGL5_MEDTR|nr:hypothetical protein MtrunA17_Chr2g0321421 [Medicago truncatula]